ncbi:MAG TPA: DMSO/selenate family reductase complex B subunit [Desulfosporosinus sp.]|nr:DMSO/selenate family reductase complex B subunit [Desulfosporosinus sp.]
MTKQLGFYYQQEHCSGCCTCQVACKDKNDLEGGQLFRKVKEFSGGDYWQIGKIVHQNIYAFWLSVSCNHCQDPVCLKNCPSGAIQKRPADGIVFIDQERCVGCHSCAENCPYGAPQFNPKNGKMGKCDFCRGLLAESKPPVCVAACPLRLLEYGQLDELRQTYGSTSRIQGMPSSDLTKPSLVITPHRDAIWNKTET